MNGRAPSLGEIIIAGQLADGGIRWARLALALDATPTNGMVVGMLYLYSVFTSTVYALYGN